MVTNDRNIQKLMEISRELIDLAIAGCAMADDDGCLLLFGIAQDCGYKMRRAACREIEFHRCRLAAQGSRLENPDLAVSDQGLLERREKRGLNNNGPVKREVREKAAGEVNEKQR